MSGGAYEYKYTKIAQLAEEMEEVEGHKHNPLRIAFAEHLKLVAAAAKAIEWVDSGDYGPGAENPAIEAALQQVHIHHHHSGSPRLVNPEDAVRLKVEFEEK